MKPGGIKRTPQATCKGKVKVKRKVVDFGVEVEKVFSRERRKESHGVGRDCAGIPSLTSSSPKNGIMNSLLYEKGKRLPVLSCNKALARNLSLIR